MCRGGTQLTADKSKIASLALPFPRCSQTTTRTTCGALTRLVGPGCARCQLALVVSRYSCLPLFLPRRPPLPMFLPRERLASSTLGHIAWGKLFLCGMDSWRPPVPCYPLCWTHHRCCTCLPVQASCVAVCCNTLCREGRGEWQCEHVRRLRPRERHDVKCGRGGWWSAGVEFREFWPATRMVGLRSHPPVRPPVQRGGQSGRCACQARHRRRATKYKQRLPTPDKFPPTPTLQVVTLRCHTPATVLRYRYKAASATFATSVSDTLPRHNYCLKLEVLSQCVSTSSQKLVLIISGQNQGRAELFP